MINYRTSEYKNNYKQEFFYKVPEYALDNNKNKLEKVGEIDLQEQLNSYKDICLNSILRRFLEPVLEIKDTYDPRRNNVDLIELGEMISLADHMREKYNLNDKIYENPRMVFEYVQKLSKDNAKSLDIEINKKVGVINGKKKTNFNEEIEKNLPQNSEQDTQEKFK